MANFVFPVVAFALFVLTSGWIWWLMTRHPERWAAVVAKENEFWIKQGLASQRFADRMKRWETSTVLRKLMFFTMVVSLAGFLWTGCYLMRAIYIEHRAVRLPFNPALQPHPFVTPPPKKAAPQAPGKTTVPARH